MHLQTNGALKLGRVPFETLPQATLQLRVAGFPKLVAHVHPLEVNVAVAEPKLSA